MSANSAVSPRNRWRIFGLLSSVLAMGGLTRIFATVLPFPIGTYAPDTFWALLVFWLVLWVRPDLSTQNAVLIALCISFGVECSQLIQVPWLISIRATRWGGLLLGHGFLWSDLLCYSLGIALGAAIDARSRAAKNAKIQ